MSKEPIPNNPTDDELESLAQDLFGVSLSEQQDVEPFDVGEFDLDELESDSEPEPVSTEEDGADPTEEVSSDAAPVDDAFGGSLLGDETESAAPAAKHQTEPVTSRDEAAAGDDLIDAGTSPDELDTGDAQDDYWDALDGFDWDEEGDTSQTKSQISKELVEASDTFEDFSIESAEKSDEFLDDADFGAGLDEDDKAAAAVTAETGDDSEEDSEAKTDRKGGRRRGRGRRRRRRDEQSAEKSDSEVSTPDAGKQRLDDVAEPDECELPADEGVSDDGFGAGLDIEDEQEQQPKKRRRRRGGRRRSSRKTEEAVPSDAAADESSPEHAPAEEESDSDVKKSKAGKYRSVPTWEEAIGYLVRAKPAQNRGGDSSKGNSRRGSRRGSGRRRRS